MASKKNLNDNPYVGSDPAFAEKRGRYELEFFFVPSGGTTNPLTVKFMAFLTEFQDKYEADWTADTVYGRMDPIATFQGTVRTISLAWAVPAYSNEEAMHNLAKMSKLISMCYPVYGSSNTSTRGAGQITGAPLIKLKFANLITSVKTLNGSGAASNGLLGWIDGVTFAPNLEAGFYDPTNNGRLELYPKQIDLSCQFHALHEHEQGWTSNAASGGKIDSDGGSFGERQSSFPYGTTFYSSSKYKKPPKPAEPITGGEAFRDGEFTDATGEAVSGQTIPPDDPSTFDKPPPEENVKVNPVADRISGIETKSLVDKEPQGNGKNPVTERMSRLGSKMNIH